jgi:thioredoxin reductase
MSPHCDVAVIGAGPYGLSVAAHLRAAGVITRVFGKPLGTWREHMPKNMTLKSDGFASNLSAPAQESTLRAWCARNRRPYASQGLPVEFEDFLAYGSDFIARFVSSVEGSMVENVESSSEGYMLTLDNSERVSAGNVIVAAGISCFPYTPPALAALPQDRRSHSYDHREGDAFAGRDVVIVGAGASAIDLAALLHDCGAKVRIVVRAPFIEYNSVPDPDAETLFYRMRRPASGIGRGWSSYFCANAPLFFYKLPESLRRRGIQSHMQPAAGWFMREKIEGRIETLPGREIAAAEETGSRVKLTLATSAGAYEEISCDHVIAATGYRPDTRRMQFLTPALRNRIASSRHTPVVSDNFETPADGLYVIGPAVIDSFGPLMRFMVGAEFIAPRLGNHLARTLGVTTRRAA